MPSAPRGSGAAPAAATGAPSSRRSSAPRRRPWPTWWPSPGSSPATPGGPCPSARSAAAATGRWPRASTSSTACSAGASWRARPRCSAASRGWASPPWSPSWPRPLPPAAPCSTCRPRRAASRCGSGPSASGRCPSTCSSAPARPCPTSWPRSPRSSRCCSSSTPSRPSTTLRCPASPARWPRCASAPTNSSGWPSCGACPPCSSGTSPRTATWPGPGRSSTSSTPSCPSRATATTPCACCGPASTASGPPASWASSSWARPGCGAWPTPAPCCWPIASRGLPGSAVVPAMEGSRPLLVEVQALIDPAEHPNPRRSAQGIDGRRLATVVAVLDQRLGVKLRGADVFALAAGGVRVHEPAADLALALALLSSKADAPLPADTVVVGEVGLGGEVRQVNHLARRLSEAARLGFAAAVVPASTPEGLDADVGDMILLARPHGGRGRPPRGPLRSCHYSASPCPGLSLSSEGAATSGLPLGLAFADAGLDVVLYDIDEDAVDRVRAGKMPFVEQGADEVLARVLANGRLTLSADPGGRRQRRARRRGHRHPRRRAPQPRPGGGGRRHRAACSTTSTTASTSCCAAPSTPASPRWSSASSPATARPSTWPSARSASPRARRWRSCTRCPRSSPGARREAVERAVGPVRAPHRRRSSPSGSRRPSWPSCSPTPGATSSSRPPTSST